MLRFVHRQRERVFAGSSFRKAVSEEPPLSRICERIVADSRYLPALREEMSGLSVSDKQLGWNRAAMHPFLWEAWLFCICF